MSDHRHPHHRPVWTSPADRERRRRRGVRRFHTILAAAMALALALAQLSPNETVRLVASLAAFVILVSWMLAVELE